MFKTKNILALLSLIGSLIWLSVFYFPDNRLHLVFCDVGQGDAILITKGFDQILIDGGPDNKVLACLTKNMPFWDKKIEMVVLTHPEADHLTGLVDVLAKYEVEYFLTGPEKATSVGYSALVSKLSAGTKVLTIYSGEKIKLGEINLASLWPEREWAGMVLGVSSTSALKLNTFSLVFLVEYGGKRILLMGDADSQVQKNIVLSNTSLPIDILKLPHHGSKTGMTEEFLAKISPKEAVISVGKNSYGHPTKEALDLLSKFDVLIRRTDKEGDINYKF